MFRRTYPQIAAPGGLWDAAMKIYPLLGAVPKQTTMEWVFPSGANIRFAHMQHETDKLNWQGSELPLLCFDELCQFTEGQFWYLLSRNRSTCGVRPYVRATCNPDADSWVARFIAWWIGEDGYAIPERSGVIRWMVRAGDEIIWADTRAELAASHPDIPPTSVTFILSTLYDNKILMDKDPGYLARLKSLPLLERERLLGDRERGGNWKIRPTAGRVFNRAWFEIVDALPADAGGIDIRFWDFAATAKQTAKSDPDFTAGVRIYQPSPAGPWYVTDCVAEQLGPADVDRLFRNTLLQDARAAKDRRVHHMVRWETEPGSAGKRETARLVASCAGHDAAGVVSTGDKLTRARPLAVQAEAGNIKLLAGDWNERWLAHMHAIPDAAHDDVMDASAGAFAALVRTAQTMRPIRTLRR